MSPRGNPQKIVTFRGDPEVAERARRIAEAQGCYVSDVHERWWLHGAELDDAPKNEEDSPDV